MFAAAGITAALAIGLFSSLLGFAGAERQRVLAEQQTRRAHQNLYVAEINLAQRTLLDGDQGLARRLLATHIPEGPGGEDLRGWEWHYLWNQLSFDASFKLGDLSPIS